MTTLKRSLFAAIFVALMAPAAASAATAAIQNFSGATPFAKTAVSFNMNTSGFSVPMYQVTDSFPGTTVTSGNMNAGGNFYWVPSTSDVGQHTLTITVSDTQGAQVVVTQVINVLPPPYISIQSVAPGNAIMPGQTYSFVVVPTGFTNPIYSVTDYFSGSTVVNSNLSSSGNFSWTPNASQNGDHVITVFASDSQGHTAQASASVRVGAGPQLTIPSNINTTLSPGQQITFSVTPSGYIPTGFSVADSFPNSTITNSSITAAGIFLWSPSASDAGVHKVTILGQVGAYGQSASTTLTINVLGPNGTVPNSTGTTGTSSGTSDVSALQAQLAALQSQLGGAGSSNTTPASTGFMFSSFLKSGAESDEVLQLQKLLQKLGYLKVAPNGYFGPSTLAAVKKYQVAKGLSALGHVGPGTRAALNADLGSAPSTTSIVSTGTKYVFEHFMGVGDDDPDVIELQKRLIALGYMTGTPTGFYGAATETAVKKYQKAKGLEETGYVAKITRMELNK